MLVSQSNVNQLVSAINYDYVPFAVVLCYKILNSYCMFCSFQSKLYDTFLCLLKIKQKLPATLQLIHRARHLIVLHVFDACRIHWQHTLHPVPTYYWTCSNVLCISWVKLYQMSLRSTRTYCLVTALRRGTMRAQYILNYLQRI